jgi:Holliday junction resolvase RusA-like endonuclease
MYHIELDLEPVSWLASIKGKHTFYNPRDKEKQIATNLLMQQWHGTPLTDYLKLKFTFIHEVPKSASLKKKKACLNGEVFPTRKDLSNCVKFYEDCLKKIVISDDRIVVKIEAEKLYGEKGKVIIEIEKLQVCA